MAVAVNNEATSARPGVHSNEVSGLRRYRLHGLTLATARIFSTWSTVTDEEPTVGDDEWLLTLCPGEGLTQASKPHDDDYYAVWNVVKGSAENPETVAYRVNLPDGQLASEFVIDLVGRSVTVSWATDWPETHEGVEFLLGSRVLPVVARLSRGGLPVHATAVEFQGRALVICGVSGAGKSTLTVALLAAGCSLLGDEPVVLDSSSEGVTASQSSLLLRVHDGSTAMTQLAQLGREVVGSRDKVAGLPTAAEALSRAPLPVAAIVVLGPRNSDLAAAEFVPLEGIEAVNALLGQRYSARGPVPVLTGDFESAAAVTALVPVLRATLPDTVDLLPQSAAQLLARAGLQTAGQVASNQVG